MAGKSYRVALDTNVLFEGRTKRESSCGLLVDVWLAELIQVCVSDALAYEYVDVLSRKLSAAKWLNTQTVLKSLLLKANFTSIHYTWRPASPDPGDDLVIDCAMNANAWLITSNKKDFLRAQTELGLVVMAPLEFITILAE